MSTILQTFLLTKCEACGDLKRKRTAFCMGCYGRLPKELRDGLWKRFGSGFEQAYTAALDWLKRDSEETDRLLA